jgi:hypothetical protein
MKYINNTMITSIFIVLKGTVNPVFPSRDEPINLPITGQFLIIGNRPIISV